MTGWNLPPGVSVNDEHINPSDRPSSILEVCDDAGWPYPVSHSDLVVFFRLCDREGYVTNVEECECARIARGEMVDPWPASKHPPHAEYARLLKELEDEAIDRAVTWLEQRAEGD